MWTDDRGFGARNVPTPFAAFPADHPARHRAETAIREAVRRLEPVRVDLTDCFATFPRWPNPVYATEALATELRAPVLVRATVHTPQGIEIEILPFLVDPLHPVMQAVMSGTPPPDAWVEHWSANGREPLQAAWENSHAPEGMALLLDLVKHPRADEARYAGLLRAIAWIERSGGAEDGVLEMLRRDAERGPSGSRQAWMMSCFRFGGGGGPATGRERMESVVAAAMRGVVATPPTLREVMEARKR